MINWIIVFYVLSNSGFVRVETPESFKDKKTCLTEIKNIDYNCHQDDYSYFEVRCEQAKDKE